MLVQLAAGRHVPPAIGAFTDNLWMTSYESSFFLEPAQIDAFEPCRPRVPLTEVV